MAFATVSVIGATSTASASGTASLGASGANKFAVEVAGVDLTQGTTVPSFRFTASWDGLVYVPIVPSYQRGNIFYFDVPAANVGVAFGGNAAGASVVVTAYALTD